MYDIYDKGLLSKIYELLKLNNKKIINLIKKSDKDTNIHLTKTCTDDK